MKIIHIGLASHYTVGMNYQDNLLTEMNLKDGHDVTYISDPYVYSGCNIKYVGEMDEILDNGLRLIRIDYDRLILNIITEKIRKASKLKNYLEEISPDVIMYHGLIGYEMITVSKYAKNNNIILYADSHADFCNTGRIIAAKLFYRYINGYFVRRILPYVRKIFYITKECKEFLDKMYRLPKEKLEFYPLGGILQNDESCAIQRKKLIDEFKLSSDSIIFSHTGRITREKKTLELVRAFCQIQNDQVHLFIAGDISEELKSSLWPLIDENANVHFLGWKSGEELIGLLNATDVYFQPGSQSATSQTALCCKCAEVVAPTESYIDMYGSAVMYGQTEDELRLIMESILEDNTIIDIYKERATSIAAEKLDYAKLAERYLQ